jgi:hypothetical protein
MNSDCLLGTFALPRNHKGCRQPTTRLRFRALDVGQNVRSYVFCMYDYVFPFFVHDNMNALEMLATENIVRFLSSLELDFVVGSLT